MTTMPSITLEVAGAKITLAADSYTRDGDKITVPSLGKTFAVEEAVSKKDHMEGFKYPTGNKLAAMHRNSANYHAYMAHQANKAFMKRERAFHAKAAYHHNFAHERLSDEPALPSEQMDKMREWLK